MSTPLIGSLPPGYAPSLTLRVKRLHPDAQLPVYATDGAACFDLHALEGGWVGSVSGPDEFEFVSPGATTFRTGLAVEVPPGHVLMIFSRSGHGFKHDVRLSNSVGIIDADYRGELMVRLRSDAAPMKVYAGDRIAQAMLLPIPAVHILEVDDLSETVRGAGGFGSTGS